MKIKLVEKSNPNKREDKKWYANAVNAGTKGLRDSRTLLAYTRRYRECVV